jgi:vacuolar-type H+-ATPase subunit H
VEIMERVWEELKKIDAQANKIKSDALDKAKKITLFANSEAEELIANSRIYAEEESQKLYSNAIQEANQQRDENLKSNEKIAEKLKTYAEKNIERAVLMIVNEVLEGN